MTGTDIQAIRDSLGLTPIQFAAAVGVTPSTVYRWEDAGPNQVRLDPLQYSLLVKAQDELGVRTVASQKSLGEELAKAVMFGGALYATYLLMQSLFDPTTKNKKKK